MKFSLANPTDAAWRQVTVRARLLGPDEKRLANQTVVERADLNPHGPMLTQEVEFHAPGGGERALSR